MTIRFRPSLQVPAVALSIVATQAFAQSCSAYLFPQHVAKVRQAEVIAPRAPLLPDTTCPDGKPSALCKGGAYLVEHDVVLQSSERYGPYSCVGFQSGKRLSVGWVFADQLRESPTAAAPTVQADWSGTWRRAAGDATLKIVPLRDGTLRADALATYVVSADNVRTGVAHGTVRLAQTASGAQVASFGEDGVDRTSVCRVEIRRLGSFLLADDGSTEDTNSACGGLGVTFNGVYLKVRLAKPLQDEKH